ncbi:MAG TPA: class I SAM-dependent methyltransferase [Armatimonadota bacterium]|jgi:SAM-dependent methyltransferase
MTDEPKDTASRQFMAAHYDAAVDGEWTRLTRDSYNELEYMTTMHLLRRYLPSEGSILDAGGGPGRYALELCRTGYDVALVDLSPGCISKAKAVFEEEPEVVQKRLLECRVEDLCDLSHFPADCFDATLCLGGPLAHLPDPADRRQAVSELVRVTRPGGIIFLTGIGALAVLRTMIRLSSYELVDGATETFFEDGNSPGPKLMLWHWFRADELRTLAESCGLETVTMAGLEGLSTGLPEATCALREHADRWQRWCEILLATAEEPAVVDMAEHLLYIGRKGEA